jgi:hypothetical protein
MAKPTDLDEQSPTIRRALTPQQNGISERLNRTLAIWLVHRFSTWGSPTVFGLSLSHMHAGHAIE